MNINTKKIKKKIKPFFTKKISLWLVLVLILQISTITALVEYYIVKKNFNDSIAALSKTTKNPEEFVQILKQQVLPQKGYTLAVRWDDIGLQLMKTGVIDKTKYEELFSGDTEAIKQMKYLSNSSKDNMEMNESNAHFMVNTLWAVGLVNKSKVLDEGPMKTEGDGSFMNYASTGGWELGARPTEELYSSQELIKLTPAQEDLVKKIANNIYRPCCGNSTAFPDCNHGMAALGYIELAVKQGISDERIYKDLLALNSFWFPQNYIELAVLFQQEGTSWDKIDSRLALSSQYSSAQGAEQVRQGIQNVPGLNIQGGGCGA
ncbi:MAG: hypothetical protein HYT09_03355 [Candidatus Levybacteria bacterium]|nr:hypothetical protein [Candidatus Levybacteria bacterium]